MPAGGTDNNMAEYQQQVIMTIIHILGNLRHAGDDVMSDIELSYPQILVLFALLEKQRLTIGELAQHLKVSQGVASRTVDRMVEKGLLQRERDSEDRRVVRVNLSEAGLDHAMRTISYHVGRLEKQFAEVGPGERESFLTLLKQIDEGLEKDTSG